MKALLVLLALTASALCSGLRAQSDLCPGATLVACGSVVAGSTLAATADVAPFCGTTDGTAGGVWFRFVGTGNPVVASLCGSGYDTKIRVFTGTCAALVCAVGNDDFCGLQSQVTWTSALGVNYYILVHGFGAGTGNYTFSLTCPPPPTPLCYAQTATPYSADPYTGTALTLTDDVHSAVVNIGFSFCYNSNSYTQCVISSNNYITFNLASAGTFSPWTTVAVPALTPTALHNSIMDPWQDIDPNVGGTIRYQTLGVAPNRRFVVSYLNVPMFSCTGQLYSSQIILYEGTNCIRSNILSKPICAAWNSGNAVHGLQNNGGTSALTVAGRNNSPWTANSEGRLWAPTCAPCSTAATGPCLALVLPVELLHFRGTHVAGRNILEWSTATEVNTSHFTVERSTDGLLFEAITEQPAAGHSALAREYAHHDEHPAPGINFYRLRTTDLDGVMDLSHVIAVETVQSELITLHPNPAQEILSFTAPQHLALPIDLELRDPTGRLITIYRSPSHQGSLSVGALANGMYAMSIRNGSGCIVSRFTVDR